MPPPFWLFLTLKLDPDLNQQALHARLAIRFIILYTSLVVMMRSFYTSTLRNIQDRIRRPLHCAC